MKLPAVAIAAAFACGIALGLHSAVVPHVTSLFFLSTLFLCVLVLIAAGLAIAKTEHLFPAAITSLLLILLIAKPLALRDSSFQLTFVAIGCIAGLAVPWLEKMVQPYVRALRGWKDVTSDAAHEPRAYNFASTCVLWTLDSRARATGPGQGSGEWPGRQPDAHLSRLGAARRDAGYAGWHVAADGAGRLETASVRILRTDRDGAVHVLTDGQRLKVTCFVACFGVGNTPSTQAKMPDQNQSSQKQ